MQFLRFFFISTLFICYGNHAVITQYKNLASNVLKIIEQHVPTTSLFFIKIQKDVFLNFVQLDSKMNLCKLIFLFPYFFHVPDWLSIPKMSWRCLNKLSLHTNITYKNVLKTQKPHIKVPWNLSSVNLPALLAPINPLFIKDSSKKTTQVFRCKYHPFCLNQGCQLNLHKKAVHGYQFWKICRVGNTDS